MSEEWTGAIQAPFAEIANARSEPETEQIAKANTWSTAPAVSAACSWSSDGLSWLRRPSIRCVASPALPKTEGRQAHDVQHEAPVAAAVAPMHLYEDSTSGRLDKRPGLDASMKALRSGETVAI